MVKCLLEGFMCKFAKLGGFKGQLQNLKWLGHFHSRKCRSFGKKQEKEGRTSSMS